jgi:hypothetical protein
MLRTLQTLSPSPKLSSLKLSTNLTRIKALQDRVLNEPSRSERERHQAALNDLVEENKRLGRVLQKAGLAIKNQPKKNNPKKAT